MRRDFFVASLLLKFYRILIIKTFLMKNSQESSKVARQSDNRATSKHDVNLRKNNVVHFQVGLILALILAIIVNMILVYFVLKFSYKIERFLGEQGINILRKVFGIILLAIGIKLFTTNIKIIFS